MADLTEAEQAAQLGAAPPAQTHTVTPEDHHEMKEGRKAYVPGGDAPNAPKEGDEETPKDGTTHSAESDSPKEESSAEATPAGEEESPEKSEAEVASAELDTTLQGWTTEFMDTGELKAETISDIYAKVFHPDLPDKVKAQLLGQLTSGITSDFQLATLSGWAKVGGQDEWDSMSEWAGKNLTEPEIKTFDAAVSGADAAASDSAIKGLHAQYQMATGATPDNEADLTHDAESATGEPAIGSTQALAAIQRTPEYQRDPAYREKIHRQLERSIKSPDYKRH